MLDQNARTWGSPRGLSICAKMGLDPDLPYINSGVLLMNLANWRHRGIKEECITALERYDSEFFYHDQDALNLVLAGQWAVLPQEWNVVPTPSSGMHLSWPHRKLAQFFLLKPHDALRRAALIHFAGKMKPWDSTILYPGARLYRVAQIRSRWKPIGGI